MMIIVIILFSAIEYSTIRSLIRQRNISDQNIDALNDSLKIERRKKGELLVSISGYVATEKELKTLNKDLWEKVQGQNGKILSLNHVIVQLSQDTAILNKYLVEKDTKIQNLLKVDSNTYIAPWSLKYVYDVNNFDIFTGKTYIGIDKSDSIKLVHVNTELIKRVTQIDLVWGQKAENDKLRVFIQSNYPGFTVKQMEGVLIDPTNNPFFKKIEKKKHWFTGFSVGLGATGGFNVTNGKYDDLVADCTIVEVITVKDSSGKVIDRVKFVEEATGDACADAPGGIIFYNYTYIL